MCLNMGYVCPQIKKKVMSEFRGFGVYFAVSVLRVFFVFFCAGVNVVNNYKGNA